ncbi:hypothetical protein A2763_02080 [Candidatus Kaiserbacteria bacterium RIFCSPHIGHO2_01_FULL_54_36]|uniref:Uncharacterized protein n=1 Tax=Candidatus Kaiserbacteria bacterium RIFCSPHIGHO2_01_FULL_54_36 TaxID=1798482 RepID=A0A1F6CPS2_9BACT|nr:MAG: hypothetical protein A2763_02080 [Candidatus Kaiserbacteria bacterium RIFCSPHIGHO2_01_FULL_54_36]OGG75897.1 MAG: hypothetical protein A3A41_04550 [Candidatus Kaiserbacteria bacterium RIFCSPLOWO2_01_FULL_54_22]
MKGKVVLILCEGNDANLCSIAADDYPGGKSPKVGDLVPLRAKRTFRATVGEGATSESKELEATYLDGLYEVREVRSGKGYDLHPKARGAPFYTLDENIEGYGITLARKRLPLDDTMKPIEARVDFGM